MNGLAFAACCPPPNQKKSTRQQIFQESAVTRRALDQSSRYADLSLDEATLVKSLSCKLRNLVGF